MMKCTAKDNGMTDDLLHEYWRSCAGCEHLLMKSVDDDIDWPCDLEHDCPAKAENCPGHLDIRCFDGILCSTKEK